MGKQNKNRKKNDPERITVEGVVSRVFNKQVSVLTDQGTVLCPLSNTWMRQKDSCLIGDEAKLELTGPGQYQIAEILPRRTAVYRGNRRAIGENILIAANPTLVIAVVTAEYMLHQVGFPEQAILAARRAGLPVLVYVSKCDLIGEEACALLDRRMAYYRGVADGCIMGSNRRVPEELVDMVKGRWAVLTGDRDSGKTALIHAVLRQLDGEEAPPYIRQSTSAANLLMSREGTVLIDTPGFRDFALNDVTEEERLFLFPEIASSASQCAFSACTHQFEEGCAVIQASREGRIARERLAAYHQLGGTVTKPAAKSAGKSTAKSAVRPARMTAGRSGGDLAGEPLVEDAYGNVHEDYRNHACLETFICQNCGQTVAPEGAGSRHRNHCPNCLCSVHVDHVPGDRASLCHGTMDPIAVWVRKGGEWALIHKCRLCGDLSSNRVAADDNPLLLMSIAVKPLANPPFPLSQLQDAAGSTGHTDRYPMAEGQPENRGSNSDDIL